jgi:hypothetical protein
MTKLECSHFFMTIHRCVACRVCQVTSLQCLWLLAGSCCVGALVLTLMETKACQQARQGKTRQVTRYQQLPSTDHWQCITTHNRVLSCGFLSAGRQLLQLLVTAALRRSCTLRQPHSSRQQMQHTLQLRSRLRCCTTWTGPVDW